MKVKEISDPVKTLFGWHLIQVLDKRAAQVPTAETEKPNITSRLSREDMEKYFADLASKAEIKLNLPKPEAMPAADKAAPAVEPTK